MKDVSPQLFVDALLGFQKTGAVKAAVELDVFSAIGQVGATARDIAARTGAAERGVRILCDYLTVHGLLHKVGERYTLTPSSAVFLDRVSPACMASVTGFLASPEMIGMFLDDPTAFVRAGGSPGLANLAPEHPVWVKFARAMVPFMAPTAQGIAARLAVGRAPKAVLDIAAGHGMFGIAIAQAVPQAQVTAVDWAPVLAVAQENATRADVAARYRTIAGSAFDVDWGTGYDVVLLPNFLHHFDRTDCISLLAKARAALAPGGRVLLVEMVPDEDRVSPPFAASFALMMLGTTPSGDAYTARELEGMAREAGFAKVQVEPLPPSPQTLLILQ